MFVKHCVDVSCINSSVGCPPELDAPPLENAVSVTDSSLPLLNAMPARHRGRTSPKVARCRSLSCLRRPVIGGVHSPGPPPGRVRRRLTPSNAAPAQTRLCWPDSAGFLRGGTHRFQPRGVWLDPAARRRKRPAGHRSRLAVRGTPNATRQHPIPLGTPHPGDPRAPVPGPARRVRL